MYYVSVTSLIFTLIINFYLFFGQNSDGKELTIDKDNISKVRFFQILLIAPNRGGCGEIYWEFVKSQISSDFDELPVQ
jgi:hypothetical protein